MKVNNVSLAAVGVKMSQYPDDGKPEVAFAGKSNVGKSTLIKRNDRQKSPCKNKFTAGKNPYNKFL